MNIRQLLLDVGQAATRPSLPEIAEAVDECARADVVNITIGKSISRLSA